MRSLFLISAGVAICFLLPACNNNKHPKASSPVPVVDVIIAHPQTISNIVEANGTIVANQYVELHPEVAGRITYLNVHEGQRVQKGTLIAKINSEDVEAQLNKSKVLLDLAVKTQERLKKLLDISGVNQSDYDATVNQANSIRADIRYYSALIDKTMLRAPFSGVLGLRNVSAGAYVATADVIASLQQLDSLKVDFTIPDEFSASIHKGDTVSVLPAGLNQVRQRATILATEPQVNTQTRNLKVRALLREGNNNIGSFAKVYVNAGANANAIMIPTSAIIPDDKSNKVILVKGGKSVYTDVKTGVRQASNIEITNGVNEGDSVAVSGILFTRTNGAVKVRSVKKLEELSK